MFFVSVWQKLCQQQKSRLPVDFNSTHSYTGIEPSPPHTARSPGNKRKQMMPSVSKNSTTAAPTTPIIPTMQSPTLDQHHFADSEAKGNEPVISTNSSRQELRSGSQSPIQSEYSNSSVANGVRGESEIIYARQIHSSGSDRSSIGGGSEAISEEEEDHSEQVKKDDGEQEQANTALNFVDDLHRLQNVAKAGKVAAMDMLNAELQKIANTVTTPPKKTKSNKRRKSQVPERTLSPPLPLLERKVSHITQHALDFRGKKANSAHFNSPLHGSRSKPYDRVKQASVRSCLLRSLCRASKPNETQDSRNSSSSNTNDGNGTVYDYMNCNCFPVEGSNALTFDSRFESGNLRKANKVTPKTLKRKFPGNRIEECQPMAVDQEYNVWCSNDLHTRGNTQWFYFSAGEPTMTKTKSNKQELDHKQNSSGSSSGQRDGSPSQSVVRKGLRVRFNIVNMRKSDSLCNFGMRPVVLSMKELESSNIGWQHEGKFEQV